MTVDQINMLQAAAAAIASITTAIAAGFFWYVTRTLAIETKRMAQATAQPHVVATLVPNRWAINHMDLHVDNPGNAARKDWSDQTRSKSANLPMRF
ncbi:MAG: hypothetical protein EOO38_01355 [Cytophagaceae bacterium]|nr:MAG: hypothetical protein EOO38_01355 [Cytophagaceae bacterium]